MMRILILIIMLLPCSLGMYASAIDSLLSVLDKTIVMRRQYEYLQPIITQYFIDNKSEIWLLFLIAHSKR